MKISIKFSVIFHEPFWIGIFERTIDERYEAARVVFGAEPKDYDVYDFILKNLNSIRFTDSIKADCSDDKRINPKRLQRKISKEIESHGIGTRAQEAIKLQYEANKTEKKKVSKDFKEKEQERKFQLKQQKKKDKHKGH